MIDKGNLKQLIEIMEFQPSGGENNRYEKYYQQFECRIQVDFDKEKIIYPEDKGFRINDTTTCNFEHPENFVVFECVNRLLEKGYRPEHLELEKRWNLGREAKGGKADICVYDKNGIDILCIIECKTEGAEYSKEINNMKSDGGQLFSYWQQERSAKWLALYSSTLLSKQILYKTDSVDCSDDANILELAKKDDTILVYKNAHSVTELFSVWDETYEKRFCGDVIFREDTQSYNIGIKPLRKKDLIDFGENDKIVNKFEEILRHNNVSDKENAFNRLIALFICKLVDEIQKTDDDITEFQYKVGSDTYESLQDRLQKLHQKGMEQFMKEKIFYVSDDYAENLVQQYTGQKRQKMIDDLKHTLRILKFYTNNDFAFKDVHNEDLFYQNGKILVEVVQLFEGFRIIGSQNLQLLGDLFEQLLNKGFKQNEGQFFTPIPITRFIWDSLPVENIIRRDSKMEFPKIIDYACGAGHFLTEGFEAINANVKNIDSEFEIDDSWVEKKLFGIEKDYRLARVSKISLFMHGAGDGNIIFGDGLENYSSKDINPSSFDILVANPPYSVAAFKPHLKLKENSFSILDRISDNGSEIETLFVERIAQLVKPNGIAAVILPSTILNKETGSYIGARESILQNFLIRAIVQFGTKTFGATGTNTIVLFLQKFNEPPKRIDLITDSINAIFDSENLEDWEDQEILLGYLDKNGMSLEEYYSFINEDCDYIEWKGHSYFGAYVSSFEKTSMFKQKIKQKMFKKETEDKQMQWKNQKFYEYAFEIEKEKIRYYAYVYDQMTLVIQSPTDVSSQKVFLGYDWSNTKGAEGIQIINPGGMLFDANNRFAENTLAGLIREMYNNSIKDLPGMEEYYGYLRLSDMVDFHNVSFNKVIKTTGIRNKVPKDGYKIYSLSNDIFETFLGDRVVADKQLVKEGKIPVLSANVYEPFGYINEQNISDFSMDSIVWGIDGDWMVNIVPAGNPFYPTDHCGVLRIKTEEILPYYLALALEVEGKFERFSRSNRASVQRIKALQVQIPDINMQKAIIEQILLLDDGIEKEKCIVKECIEGIQREFIGIFGDPETNSFGWNIELIGNVVDEVKYGTSLPAVEGGKYPYIRMNNITFDGYLDLSNLKYIDVPEDDVNKYIVRKGDILFNRTNSIELVGKTCVYDMDDEMIIAGYIIKVRVKDHILPEYMSSFMNTSYMKKQLKKIAKGSINQANINAQDLQGIAIMVPPMEKQMIFADRMKKMKADMMNAQEKIDELNKNRHGIIMEHFV